MIQCSIEETWWTENTDKMSQNIGAVCGTMFYRRDLVDRKPDKMMLSNTSHIEHVHQENKMQR